MPDVAQAHAGPRDGVVRVGNASGFYGDRFSAMREMLDRRPARRAHRRLPGRADHAHPRPGPAQGPGHRVREDVPAPDARSCLGLALDRGSRSWSTPVGSIRRASRRPSTRPRATGCDRVAPDRATSTGRRPRPGRRASTANAYLGAFGIAECLRAGADVVVTGRVTDASLVVGPAIAHFGWGRDDLDALAGATVAGHVLECGAQATGGNFAFFTELADPAPPRLPDRRDRTPTARA